MFDVSLVKRFTLPGRAYVRDCDIISDDGTTPYVVAKSVNNGISGYSKYAPNNEGGCITLSITADSANTVFYQQSQC